MNFGVAWRSPGLARRRCGCLLLQSMCCRLGTREKLILLDQIYFQLPSFRMKSQLLSVSRPRELTTQSASSSGQWSGAKRCRMRPEVSCNQHLQNEKTNSREMNTYKKNGGLCGAALWVGRGRVLVHPHGYTQVSLLKLPRMNTCEKIGVGCKPNQLVSSRFRDYSSPQLISR
jgi:hypothetical protein